MTLTIHDSKPFVEFFAKLGNIISHFENKPIYQPVEQMALKEVIPLIGLKLTRKFSRFVMPPESSSKS